MAAVNRKDLALQSAEKIFADFGYDRATMRMIADDADLKLALLTYHFTTKLNLYRAVFEEHQHLNELRRERLREVDLAAPQALEEIVDAFLVIGDAAEEGVRKERYLKLVLREAADPRAYERGIIADLFDPMAAEFIEALGAVLPGKPKSFVRWDYLFSVGALIMSNSDDRARALGGGESDAVHRLEHLREFIVAGLRAGTAGS
ncbi:MULTISPECIES: TetR/AcrR family transcriptional regulator [Brevibacterium]|jgi:AcrR family transcriptional regulator|uniref:TetR family transcriptional regulator n=1 Tax=Brevibacterium casei TaxID=33889 RepID=A0A7T4DKE9_9MICO|nr:MULTISPECIES: TetR/AcrR family transcriptional regulator [Brevibacterium]QQB15366.1 TetR family transcriptional regulator [Brevibacterium casei]